MAKKKSGSKKGPAKKTVAKKVAKAVKTESIEEVKEILEDLTTTETEEETAEAVIIPVPEPVDTWRDRVKSEAADLKEKITKLRTALDQNKVPHDQIAILSKQHGVMKELYIILNTRLSNH
jgi:hypothetical protein